MTRSGLGITFTPLVPKGPVVDLRVPNRVDRVMRQAGGKLVALRKTYPPALPWTSRPPRTGPRAGGRRTGQLARGWRVRFGRGSFDVWNPVLYAGYVQGFSTGAKGKRQTSVMRNRRWRNFNEDIGRLNLTLKPGLRKAFKQSRR